MSALSSAADDKFEVDVLIGNRAELDFLAWSGYEITSRHGPRVSLLTDGAGISSLQAAGIPILPAEPPAQAADYPSYDETVDELLALQEQYPNLVAVTELGPTSTGARSLWLVKISEDVGTNEIRPGVLFDASIHGDEQVGTAVVTAFIRRVLDGYDAGDEYGDLARDFELWFIPMANPDGAAQVQRHNGRGVDLNRNFPMNWDRGSFGGNEPASEAETRMLVEAYRTIAPALAIQYHSGAALVNFPLDSTPQASPDEELIIALSGVYGGAAGYPIINGYDWYMVNGISEESSYQIAGALSVIVELSRPKMPGGSQLDGVIAANLPAMRAWALEADTGVAGVVYDFDTGEGLDAVVQIGDGWPCYTDLENGDFHRPALPGHYTVHVTAAGYETVTVSTDVVDSAPAFLDIGLQPEIRPTVPARQAMLSVMHRPAGNFDNKSFARDALGHPDATAYSIGTGGEFVLDFGEDGLSPGAILTVYELEDDGEDAYSAYLSDRWTGVWMKLGDGIGTMSFDVPSANSFRYLRILDNGNGPADSPKAGADIDAVVQAEACLAPAVSISASATSGEAPLTVSLTGIVSAAPECVQGMHWEFGDGTGSEDASAVHTFEEVGAYLVIFSAWGDAGSASASVTILVHEELPDGTPTADDTDDDDDGDDDDGDDDDDAAGACGC